MIKKLLLILLIFCVTGVVNAQRFPGGPPPSYEEKEAKIKAHKIAFITEKLNLSPNEAQDFWPVFNEYDQKNGEIKKSMKEIKKKLRKMDSMTDEDIATAMNDMLDLQKQEVTLREEYHAKFLKVIGVRKTALLYKAEREFKKVLLGKLRGEGPPPPPR